MKASDLSTDSRLKTSPPRYARQPLPRRRLSLASMRFKDVPAGAVCASAGYGKTSLLVQWRQECLSHGMAAAWYSSSKLDSPDHLALGIIQSYRLAALRPTFGHGLRLGGDDSGLEVFSRILAEIETSALDSALFIDDAEALPAASKSALSYLLRNLPANLRLFIGMRSLDGFDFDDIATYGQCEIVGSADLVFKLDETFLLFREKLGERFSADTAAQMHNLTLGWPLGLQLILSAQMRDDVSLIPSLSTLEPGSKTHEHLVSMLFAKLNERDSQVLVEISIFDEFTAELCASVSGATDAADILDTIAKTTPVIQLTDQSDWMRLHAFAKTVLQKRFDALPVNRQKELHHRAADWLEENGMTYKAARHAFAAGEVDRALDLAERSAHQKMMTEGGARLLDWSDVLPDHELDKRPKLLLAEAWSLALSDQHVKAESLVERIRSGREVNESLDCECDLILGGAAVFADDPDRFERLHDRWAVDPPLDNPTLLRVHANRFAYKALLDGEPGLARLRQQRAPDSQAGRHTSYLSHWSDFIIGLSYLWEGQVRQAERIVRPALLQSESDIGRRDPLSVMLAAVLATSEWEQGRSEAVELLFADRLDILERRGLPEAMMLGFRTLSRLARAQGDDARALELLAALDAIGTRRKLPRMNIVSLCEQIRMHAARNRAESCNELLVRLEDRLQNGGVPGGMLWKRSVAVPVDLARGLTAIAAKDWQKARISLEQANVNARAAKQERLVIESAGLLSLALHQCGENALSMAHEAMQLAELYGLSRVFADAHPALTEWFQSLKRSPSSSEAPRAEATVVSATPPEPSREIRSMVLTPREWDVLEHLSRNLTNKEIARSLDVHDETVKWHVKNLFAKLDAGSRKQVVLRARLMGLLPPQS